jgi:hypothetical protein
MKVLAALLIAIAVPAAARADSSYQVTRGVSTVSVQTTGNVTIDIGSNEIFDLHGDGTLHVHEVLKQTVRDLRASRDGVTFTVDGAAHTYDKDAKMWLRRVLSAIPKTPEPPK